MPPHRVFPQPPPPKRWFPRAVGPSSSRAAKARSSSPLSDRPLNSRSGCPPPSCAASSYRQSTSDRARGSLPLAQTSITAPRSAPPYWTPAGTLCAHPAEKSGLISTAHLAKSTSTQRSRPTNQPQADAFKGRWPWRCLPAQRTPFEVGALRQSLRLGSDCGRDASPPCLVRFLSCMPFGTPWP